MTVFLVRRLMQSVVVLFVMSIIVFAGVLVFATMTSPGAYSRTLPA